VLRFLFGGLEGNASHSNSPDDLRVARDGFESIAGRRAPDAERMSAGEQPFTSRRGPDAPGMEKSRSG